MDNECICKGDWRDIIKKIDKDIDSIYKKDDDLYTFFGLVHGSDDYYYGMFKHSDGKLMLLSCIGNIEVFGFEKVGSPTNEFYIDSEYGS